MTQEPAEMKTEGSIIILRFHEARKARKKCDLSESIWSNVSNIRWGNPEGPVCPDYLFIYLFLTLSGAFLPARYGAGPFLEKGTYNLLSVSLDQRFFYGQIWHRRQWKVWIIFLGFMAGLGKRSTNFYELPWEEEPLFLWPVPVLGERGEQQEKGVGKGQKEP